jgi:hypothetical protein
LSPHGVHGFDGDDLCAGLHQQLREFPGARAEINGGSAASMS